MNKSTQPESTPDRTDEDAERVLRPAPKRRVEPNSLPASKPSQAEPAASPHALSLAISPVASALAATRDDVRTFLRGFDVPESTLFDVVLSLEEACKNAIRFSGSGCPIDVTVAVHAGEVRLVIRDHGVGFKPRHVDVSQPPDPLDPQGRGLFLMTRLMDDVQIDSDRGAIVTARKTVAS